MDVYLHPVPAFANDADVKLLVPGAVADEDPWDDRKPRRGRQLRRPPAIVAESLHRSLVRRYGLSEGPRIYDKMLEERKGPFQPGAKYDPDRRGKRKPPAD